MYMVRISSVTVFGYLCIFMMIQSIGKINALFFVKQKSTDGPVTGPPGKPGTGTLPVWRPEDGTISERHLGCGREHAMEASAALSIWPKVPFKDLLESPRAFNGKDRFRQVCLTNSPIHSVLVSLFKK